MYGKSHDNILDVVNTTPDGVQITTLTPKSKNYWFKSLFKNFEAFLNYISINFTS